MIYEAFPEIDIIAPMLISKTPKDAIVKINSGDYIGTEKIDGYFYQMMKANNEVYLFSRNLSTVTKCYTNKIDNVPHLKAWFEGLPNNTTLIGEVYVEGGTSKDVTKILGCKPEKAFQRQFDSNGEYAPVKYYIHDVIRLGDEDLSNKPYTERLEYLQNVIAPQIDSEYIEIAKPVYENLEQALQEVFDKGGEGMVFRHKDSIYEPGKRPKTIFKIKTEETFDAVIMDFVNPERVYTGKELDSWQYFDEDGTPVTKAYYNGWKAGIDVGAFDNDGVLHSVGTIASGMTDFLREDMANNPDKYLNKVVEIQAMSVDPKEQTIRHGRLMRVRDDKNAEECTLDNIFGK